MRRAGGARRRLPGDGGAAVLEPGRVGALPGWGCDVIGMTNMPEAKLAREAELCYASVAMVTDYDCWHPDHDHVQVTDIIRVLTSNAEHARGLVATVVPKLAERPIPVPRAATPRSTTP